MVVGHDLIAQRTEVARFFAEFRQAIGQAGVTATPDHLRAGVDEDREARVLPDMIDVPGQAVHDHLAGIDALTLFLEISGQRESGRSQGLVKADFSPCSQQVGVARHREIDRLRSEDTVHPDVFIEDVVQRSKLGIFPRHAFDQPRCRIDVQCKVRALREGHLYPLIGAVHPSCLAKIRRLIACPVKLQCQ